MKPEAPKPFVSSSYVAIIALICLTMISHSPAQVTAEIKVHETETYSEKDATDALQKAVDSGAQTLILSAGRPWVLHRQINIEGRKNITILMEPGVMLEAAEGAFLPTGETMLVIRDSDQIAVIGYGATMRMRKKDYQDPARYKPAEWRNTISILGSADVTVRGLTLEASGGDGIYVAENRQTGGRRYSSNITIEDVRAIDHHRQGMSVVSVDGLLVRRCVFSSTEGTAPQAGIDFEPDEGDHRLANIRVLDCHFHNNAGAAILAWISNQNRTAPPISITVERPHVDGGSYGFIVGDYGLGAESGPGGTILFRDATIRNTRGPGLLVRNKTSAENDVTVQFENIRLWDVAVDKSEQPLDAPIVLQVRDDAACRMPMGGVIFDRIQVRDGYHRPVMKAVFADAARSDMGIARISGDITLYGDESLPPALGDKLNNVAVDIKTLDWNAEDGSAD